MSLEMAGFLIKFLHTKLISKFNFRAVANALLNRNEPIDITNGNPPLFFVSKYNQDLFENAQSKNNLNNIFDFSTGIIIFKNHLKALSYWNSSVEEIESSCQKFSEKCLTLRYENLAIDKERTKMIKTIGSFIGQNDDFGGIL